MDLTLYRLSSLFPIALLGWHLCHARLLPAGQYEAANLLGFHRAILHDDW